MAVFSDLRRLRLFRVRSAKGQFSSEQAADLWQGPDGKIECTGLWKDSLVPRQEDLRLEAQKLGVSPLELLRQRFLQCAAVRVEVTGYEKV